MRFRIRHEFNAPVASVEDAMLHADYPTFLLEHHGVLLEVEPKSRTESDQEVRRSVRYRPKPVIAKIGPKPVPPEWFAFLEESVYDRKKKELQFANVPTSGKIEKLLINKGTIQLRPLGADRCERVVEGELRLALPFLLRPLAAIGEKVIHGEAVKLLDREADVMNKWLSERA